MRKHTIVMPVAKPRNPIVRALIARFGSANRRHKTAKDHADRLSRLPVDQRVRECGEW